MLVPRGPINLICSSLFFWPKVQSNLQIFISRRVSSLQRGGLTEPVILRP
jgi:hypothetical protein